MAGTCVPAPTRTRTCSGACAAPARTSASRPRFEFDLHPLGPMITRGFLIFPAARAARAVRGVPRLLPHGARRPDGVRRDHRGPARRGATRPRSRAGRSSCRGRLLRAEADADRVLAPLQAPRARVTRVESVARALPRRRRRQRRRDAAWGHRVYTRAASSNDLPVRRRGRASSSTRPDRAGDDSFAIWTQGGAIGRRARRRDGVSPARRRRSTWRAEIDVGRRRRGRRADRRGCRAAHRPSSSRTWSPAVRQRVRRRRRRGLSGAIYGDAKYDGSSRSSARGTRTTCSG